MSGISGKITFILRLWPTQIYLIAYPGEFVLRSNGWHYGRWLEIPRV